MRFIRENLFYVILIGATVVASAVLMVMAATSDVEVELKKRRNLSTSLRRLARQREKPDDRDLKRQQEILRSLKEAADKDVADSVEFNRRNLRVLRLKIGATDETDAFPIDPVQYKRYALRYVFTKQYGDTLTAMLQMPGLRRTTGPTAVEIKKEELLLKETRPKGARELAERSMILKKAEAGTIYVEDDALDRYFEAPKAKASDSELWEAQVNLWVTQEVLQAIIKTNAEVAVARGQSIDEMNVLDAAVKRLIKININESYATAGTTGFGAARAPARMLTGRITTRDYGVIDYRFSVVMATRHVKRLLRNLMTSNYHCVVDVGMSDLATEGRERLYYYGTEPVMAVDIGAEMLLVSEWCRPLMPQAVLSKLPGAAAKRTPARL